MPSPGISKLRENLSNISYEVQLSDGNVTTLTIQSDSDLVLNLGEGLHNGWTCESPDIQSTFYKEITDEFGNLSEDAGKWIESLGKGLDEEVQEWIDSYIACPSGESGSPSGESGSPSSTSPSPCDVHEYEPKEESIVERVKEKSPIWSSAIETVTKRVAEVFVKYFDVEEG